MSEIEKNLLEWSNSRLSVKGGLEVLNIRPLRQEASARKYFRINSKENTYVGVYSPPEVESNEQFIFLANLCQHFIFRKIHLRNPRMDGSRLSS